MFSQSAEAGNPSLIISSDDGTIRLATVTNFQDIEPEMVRLLFVALRRVCGFEADADDTHWSPPCVKVSSPEE
ncbi:hypothetical protein SK128_028500 [Halocaridina rubra]|uniref:Uncharacterized protein n=1 Tax=Halocaridina rubra TaxID=373956 RepID=A0AAN8WP90_HALRR